MTEQLAKVVRMEWGVPLTWARNNPDYWPMALRHWLAQARAKGLTVITVFPEKHHVGLAATLPGDRVDYEGL